MAKNTQIADFPVCPSAQATFSSQQERGSQEEHRDGGREGETERREGKMGKDRMMGRERSTGKRETEKVGMEWREKSRRTGDGALPPPRMVLQLNGT